MLSCLSNLSKWIILLLCYERITGCPNGWSAKDGVCYFLSEHSATWSDAASFCHNFGAILSQPKQKRIMTFLAELIRTHHNHANQGEYWIGAGDFFAEGSFIWMDMTPVEHAPWAPGEPTDSGHSEDCVALYAGGIWNDLPCESKWPFICEMEDGPVPAIG